MQLFSGQVEGIDDRGTCEKSSVQVVVEDEQNWLRDGPSQVNYV
ncbi:unnamed protein product [Protopolystoma xenopodis]|uniref:Uncharacterized protein n=1 Tax=Protopolystoma xenopodis TaxID=117903 RepID=A0A3S5B052_9PLAT|nr:unnamed protein product [Protopolystoma xenopodis]